MWKGLFVFVVYIHIATLGIITAVGVSTFTMFGIAWMVDEFGVGWTFLYAPWVVLQVMWVPICISICVFTSRKIEKLFPEELTCNTLSN